MALKRTSHSVYDTRYHLVWCPKRRRDVFRNDEVRERTEQLFGEICSEYGFEIIELEIAKDHIHVMLSFPPKRSIGEVVRILKSKSAASCSGSSRGCGADCGLAKYGRMGTSPAQ